MKLNDIRLSAIAGTICSIWATLSLGDVLQTALTAAVGTLVSFLTSRMIGRWNNRERK